MLQKTISCYNETDRFSGTEEDRLLVGIGCGELFFIVTGGVSKEIEAFECFTFNDKEPAWDDLFQEAFASSMLLNRAYRYTTCVYHFAEAMLVPEQVFSPRSAVDHLALLFGECAPGELKHCAADHGIVTAFRVQLPVQEMLGRHFVLHKPYHVYAAAVKDLLHNGTRDDHFMKVQFYHRHMIVSVMKHGKLLLVQSFAFTNGEDVLYHLTNIAQQFSFDALHSHIEISGIFESGSTLHQSLQPLFGLISFDGMQEGGVLRTLPGYPSHYFTPFVKLVS